MRMVVTGVKELDEVFKGLPLQLNDRILQQAHAAAAKPLVDREKLTAPEGPTGNLIDSIGVLKASGRSVSARELGAVNVGPRLGRRYKGHAGHLVEYGTAIRQTKKGANRGKMKPRPFALPAWSQTKDQVLGSINTQIAIKLYAFMRRTLRG